jgi:sigma-B regulation protein RsbU (phosphoserine phosphatase)
MLLNDAIAGVLAVANKIDGPMASPDRKLGQAIANQAGIHFENLLFAEQRVAEARLQTELKLARDVQMQLLPQRPPEVPGLDIYGFSEPAMQVGGDTYDFLVGDDQRFHCCLGDVSGKGMSAALIMTMMRTALRNSWRFNPGISPAMAIERTNTSLYADFTETGMFATLFAASYNPDGKRLHYANAGHSPVIYRPREGRAQLLEADGVPVGVLTESLVEDRSLHFGEGDLLIVCTDGLNEAQNRAGELFGRRKLLELADKLGEQPSEMIAQELLEAVNAFASGQPQADDQTLVVVRGVAG